MKNKLPFIVAILVLAMALSISLFVGVPTYQSKFQNKTVVESKLGILVTIPPQEQFVKRIGGDKVEVTVLVPAGASPHTYEPTPQQMTKAAGADMYAKVGSGVEFELSWAGKLAELNPDMLIVDSSKGVIILQTGEEDEEDEGQHESGDPHIWNSIKNAKIMVQNVYDGLVQIDPQNTDYYKANLDSYLTELDSLDKNISSSLEEKKNNYVMVYHDAWNYLANDYDLNLISIETQGKEPTPQGIAALIDQAKKDNITIIFASPEFSTQSAETIANEIGGSVALVSPLEADYVSNMARVAEAFAEA